MKKFILASSLATMAVGETTPSVKSMPAAQRPKSLRQMIDAERKSRRAASKADAKVAKSTVEAAHAVVKEEGLVFTEFHSYSDFFEITQGMSDCTSTIGRVEGWEAGRCVDWVIEDGDGLGMTESEMIVKPNNYGFPIVLFFAGHGCREEKLVDLWRMPKTEFGFPPEYTTGGCMPMYEDSSVTPSFYQNAMWTYMRHEPLYPAVMQGTDGKDKGCRRNKYAEYEILAAWMCKPTQNEDGGSPEWSYFDISNCDAGSVTEMFFSDPSCSTGGFLRQDVYRKEECVFDYEEFRMEMDDYGDAPFHYRSRDCSWGTAP